MMAAHSTPMRTCNRQACMPARHQVLDQHKRYTQMRLSAAAIAAGSRGATLSGWRHDLEQHFPKLAAWVCHLA